MSTSSIDSEIQTLKTKVSNICEQLELISEWLIAEFGNLSSRTSTTFPLVELKKFMNQDKECEEPDVEMDVENNFIAMPTRFFKSEEEEESDSEPIIIPDESPPPEPQEIIDVPDDDDDPLAISESDPDPASANYFPMPKKIRFVQVNDNNGNSQQQSTQRTGILVAITGKPYNPNVPAKVIIAKKIPATGLKAPANTTSIPAPVPTAPATVKRNPKVPVKIVNGQVIRKTPIVTIPAPPINSFSYLNCEICGATFSQASNLDIHRSRIHAGAEIPYSCSLCPESSFKDFGELNLHISTLHPEHIRKPFIYTCQWCDKEFENKGLLQHHIKYKCSTANLKPYKCQFCDETFSMESNLDVHTERLHPSDTPYTCKLCPASFPELNQLRIHTEEEHPPPEPPPWQKANLKKYICKYCSKVFYDEMELKKHHKTHHSKPKPLPLETGPYKCDLCDEEFVTLSAKCFHQRGHVTKTY